MALTVTVPYRQAHYVGEYAGDAAANAAIASVGWTLSKGMLYFDNTGSVDELKVYDGTAWQTLSTGGGGVAQWNEQNIVHVAPHGSDSNDGDAINLAKLTIGSAITRATALSPSATNPITILIHPGEYDEDNTSVDSYVNFVGVDRDACIIKPSTSGSAPLGIVDNNVNVENLTISRASGTSNFTLYVDTATGVKVNNCRVVMDGANNDEVNLRGASEVEFRDCIFEDIVSDANLILDDTTGGTYRFFNCTFKGRSLIVATYYFYDCHFQANSTQAVVTASGASPNIFRMYGCTVRRSGATNGDGIQISNAGLDWGLIGCDIDAALGTGNDDVISLNTNPGAVHGCIIGTRLSETVILKSEARRFVRSSGGIDVYDSLLDALNSLPLEGGVVELTEDYDMGASPVDPRTGTTGKVILEGNGFTVTGHITLSWFDTRANSIFELRNVTLNNPGARLGADATMVLRNVKMTGRSYILINSPANASSKILIDNVDVDGSGLSSNEQPIRSTTSNAAEIHVNDSSFTGRSIAGNTGAAVYFSVAGPVLRAINSLFIHPIGGVSDYEIDANAAVTVYTQYCMTRANAIGAAANVTEGITGTNNIVDANAGFLWRE